MFHKPFRVKSSTQMKGSDKKKLKAELKKKFAVLHDDALNSLIPAKEEVMLTKLQTHTDGAVLAYIHNKTPLFFELDKERGSIFPTVYALWRHPDLLSSFPTWPPVAKKLANGADLMLPGVVVDKELGLKAYNLDGRRLQKGDALQVNLVTNRAALAVGTAALSSEDMYMAGGRGRGVRILHCYGDQLWESGSKVEMPELGEPPGLDFLSKSEEKSDEDEADPDGESDSGDDLEAPDICEEEKITDDIASVVLNEESALPDDHNEIVEEDERSPQEIMDELLERAFLQAWKTSARKVELPMLSSNFFRVHMVPQTNRPLDIKKSSHRKLSKFLAHMESKGVIKVKELQKGVESLTEVNIEHELIARHRVVKPQRSADSSDEENENVLPCDRPYEPPTITDLFVVGGQTVQFFKATGGRGHSKGSGLTGAEVREVVKKYVAENGLQDEADKSVVKLDPVLASAVLAPRGENDVERLKWDKLISRLQTRMSRGYAMQFPGEVAPRVTKGKLEPVQILTQSRGGRKTITCVRNLEPFRIDPSELARRCQVGVSGSATVRGFAGSTGGQMEVMVQGPHAGFLSKLMSETYGIPRKYINGFEESSKKKGGR